jgi:hypothetical protein
MSAAEYQIGGGHSAESELKMMFNKDFDISDTLETDHAFSSNCTHWAYICSVV